ncbi:hypothetical protein BD779DRAFT_1180861 [Infundibulicybe gibba]|nr:hypothetical protein BD779DRAFT_1180861 [Infundibulicybe gibba]
MTQFHYVYFDIPQLSPGPHSLVVVMLYNHTHGTRTRTLVTLNNFIVDNAPLSLTTSPPSLLPIAPPPPPSTIPPTTATIHNNRLSTPPPLGPLSGASLEELWYCVLLHSCSGDASIDERSATSISGLMTLSNSGLSLRSTLHPQCPRQVDVFARAIASTAPWVSPTRIPLHMLDPQADGRESHPGPRL